MSGVSKYEFWIGLIATSVAIIGTVVTVQTMGIETLRTEIREMDRRYELRQENAEKTNKQWQDLVKENLELRASKK